MGKTELVTSLLRTVTSKSTFLQVGRAATKGNIIQKGMELQGKQAIKFFEKMPCDFQKYVQTVNLENLTVRYGVKGYNGSSVTGFQVLDGENVIAKGAMGIDKTYGKKPILQMRAQLFQGEQKAGINFKYDGNRVFDGYASTNSTFKDGRFNMQSNYGNTLNFEYSETNNFSNWLNQHGWKRFDSIETPTARQFAEFKGKFDKGIREFVSGRRTYTPQQREQMKIEKLKKQEYKAEKRQYLKEQKAQIKEQMLREIEELRANPKLKKVTESRIELQNYNKKATAQINESKEQVKVHEKTIKEYEQKLEELQQRFKSINKAEIDAEFQQHQEKIAKLAEEEMKLWNAGKIEEASAKMSEVNQLEFHTILPKRNQYYTLKGEISRYEFLLSGKINDRARLLKEIETLTANVNKYKTAIIKTQNYEKATRSDIAKQIKEVRTRYKAELDKYYPRVQKKMEEERRLAELAEKEKALREQEIKKIEKQLKGKKLSSKSLKEQLKKENIQPYQNQEVVNQIRNLKGSTIEVAEQSKNIFLKEMGFNPELVKVKQISHLEQGFNDFTLAFEPVSGRINISPNYKGNSLLTSSAIRHELDHFQLFADLCKSMGVENFKKMLLAKYPQVTPEMYNAEFWNKAIQNAKVLSPAEVSKYTKSFKEYELPGLFNDDVLTKIKYFGNPIETRAYDVQASIGKSLGLKTNDIVEGTVMSRLSRRMVSAIERLEQKTGKTINSDYLEKIIQAEILKVNGDEIDQIKVMNNVLNKLENV